MLAAMANVSRGDSPQRRIAPPCFYLRPGHSHRGRSSLRSEIAPRLAAGWRTLYDQLIAYWVDTLSASKTSGVMVPVTFSLKSV